MTSATSSLPGVLLLGPPIEHREGLQTMLEPHAAVVRWVPDSFTFLRSEADGGALARIGRKLDPLLGTRDPRYLAMLETALDETRAEVVVAYWGTLPIADVIALRRLRPKLRIVLWMLCYPLSLQTPGLLRQRLILSRAASAVDVVICPGPDMAAHLKRHEFAGSRARLAEVRPCWPGSFQATTLAPAHADRPNVVYVGRPDLSGATVHAADDVRAMLRGLLDAGIVVRHGRSKEMSDGHPLREQFDAVPVPRLTGLMNAHDASLMAYNVAACARAERFEFTVPDRLISSVAAGVPVAIPAQGYAASKAYLRDYPAVIEFASPGELHGHLSDRDAVQRLRESAWQSRGRYTAEAQSGAMRDAVGLALDR